MLQVRVMLRPFSSSCASNGTAITKNSIAFADDDFNIRRNMCMDDLHLFTYRRESLNERGIYTTRSKKRSRSCSTIDGLTLCNSVESMDNCIEAGSACFLQTKMMFFIEKSSSLSVAESVLSPLRFAEKELESPTSEQKMDWLPQTLIRLPQHEKLCPTDEFGKNDCRSIEETMHEGRGKFSKYLVLDINVAKVLGSAKRSLVKLLSLQDDVVSSADIALNVGLSSICTATDINSTVRLWDIEFGIMTRRERASLFVWDPRDFFKPLNFSVGNMFTFHSVQFIDNQVCVSDCFNDRLFDLRMIGSSPVEVVSPAKLSSSYMKKESSMTIERTNCLEDMIFFSHDDEENEEDDNEFYESKEYGVVDSEKSSRSCLLEQFEGALRLIGVH